MHIVAVYGWQQAEAEVARTIAETMGMVVFEARQKIANGGPAVVASFADPQQAERLADNLSQGGVPALVIDPDVVRDENRLFPVSRFVLGSQGLELESLSGDSCELDYRTIELLLVAMGSSGQMQITEAAQRKFSFGKTLLAGGIPMTKEVKGAKTVTIEERDETLWLYARDQTTVIFDRAVLNYEGLGEAMQFTRDLNFAHLKKELQRLAPQAIYDDRLLKRAALIRVLGPALNPEADLDLAFEILARSFQTE